MKRIDVDHIVLMLEAIRRQIQASGLDPTVKSRPWLEEQTVRAANAVLKERDLLGD